MKLTRFEDLDCWQEAVSLSIDLYRISSFLATKTAQTNQFNKSCHFVKNKDLTPYPTFPDYFKYQGGGLNSAYLSIISPKLVNMSIPMWDYLKKMVGIW